MACSIRPIFNGEYDECPVNPTYPAFSFTGTIAEVRTHTGGFQIDILSGERINTVGGNGEIEGAFPGILVKVTGKKDGTITVKSLRHYGGDGFCGCREDDPYKVADGMAIRVFSKFSEAKCFYDSLNGERFFWDLRRGELLDAWSFQEEETSNELPFK